MMERRRPDGYCLNELARAYVLSIRKLFANLASSPEIKCERQDAICEWLTAPRDWIKASGIPDSIELRRCVRF
jgi:hypothetical protein